MTGVPYMQFRMTTWSLPDRACSMACMALTGTRSSDALGRPTSTQPTARTVPADQPAGSPKASALSARDARAPRAGRRRVASASAPAPAPAPATSPDPQPRAPGVPGQRSSDSELAASLLRFRKTPRAATVSISLSDRLAMWSGGMPVTTQPSRRRVSSGTTSAAPKCCSSRSHTARACSSPRGSLPRKATQDSACCGRKARSEAAGSAAAEPACSAEAQVTEPDAGPLDPGAAATRVVFGEAVVVEVAAAPEDSGAASAPGMNRLIQGSSAALLALSLSHLSQAKL
ncbi:Non-specific phospholipase C4 [Frankliniella fusca]|uniref:Non-specific phospholipase C4 n=1 Tax=Frankliniella fusca TaxID=407009 RepID=A0AAE1H4V0_9NEOP|nr:Non-specific phospholipase C4 [Frankliniella fusca]